MMNSLLGIGDGDLTIAQMCLRAAVVYIVALLFVRVVGDRRFAGKYAAIDIVLSITLGATLSRAISSEGFFPIIAAGFVLVAMHWITGSLTYHIPIAEKWLKGSPLVLVRDGQMKTGAFAASSLTKRDLETVMRSQSKRISVDDIALAMLETNGDITIIPKSSATE